MLWRIAGLRASLTSGFEVRLVTLLSDRASGRFSGGLLAQPSDVGPCERTSRSGPQTRPDSGPYPGMVTLKPLVDDLGSAASAYAPVIKVVTMIAPTMGTFRMIT